jgi:hypothetical protein
MKSRNILWIITLACISCMSACVDDRGNYDYIPKENVFPVEISGLQDSSFLVRSTVELHPEVKGLDADLSKYDFLWYTYPLNAVGYAPQRDTIATSLNLSFVITYPPGERRELVFQITEKSTGIIANHKVEITTSSLFSRGWFVVNDLNDQTDVDFITLSGEVNEGVISSTSGQKLRGKGLKIVLQNGYYYHEKLMPDGTLVRLTNQTVFHVLSDQDLKTLNAADLEIYKNWEDEFFSAPAVRKPQDITASYMGYVYLINDGKLHAIMGMTAGPGKFAYAKIGGEDLYPRILSSDFGQEANVFSCATSSFLVENMADLFNVESGSGVPAVNMEHDMLWMERRFQRYSSSTQAWAIMRSKTAPVEYHLVDIDAYGSDNPIMDFHLLNPAARVLSADVYGVHPEHTAAFYFAKGNLLSYFQKGDSSGDDEVDLYTFPLGETVSYVAKNSTTTNLEVLTNSNNAWKLYIFALAGNGNARYVLYR